jgi:hypothetical protein
MEAQGDVGRHGAVPPSDTNNLTPVDAPATVASDAVDGESIMKPISTGRSMPSKRPRLEVPCARHGQEGLADSGGERACREGPWRMNPFSPVAAVLKIGGMGERLPFRSQAWRSLLERPPS